jgi:hypothetical protein
MSAHSSRDSRGSRSSRFPFAIRDSYGGAGGVVVDTQESESTSFPGRLVSALSTVAAPEVVTKKCWMLLPRACAPTVTGPVEKVAVSLPRAAPPLWLLAKCHLVPGGQLVPMWLAWRVSVTATLTPTTEHGARIAKTAKALFHGPPP